jgi:hypothetical protein
MEHDLEVGEAAMTEVTLAPSPKAGQGLDQRSRGGPHPDRFDDLSLGDDEAGTDQCVIRSLDPISAALPPSAFPAATTASLMLEYGRSHLRSLFSCSG